MFVDIREIKCFYIFTSESLLCQVLGVCQGLTPLTHNIINILQVALNPIDKLLKEQVA